VRDPEAEPADRDRDLAPWGADATAAEGDAPPRSARPVWRGALAGRGWRGTAPRVGAPATFVIGLAWATSKGLFLTVAGLALFAAAVPAATLLLVKEIVDAYTGAGGSGASGTELVLVLGLLTVARAGAVAAMGHKREELAERLSIKAQERLLGIAGSAHLALFDDAKWHDSLARANEGVVWRPAQAMNAVIELVSAVVAMVTLGGLLVSLDPRLIALAGVGAIPLLAQRRAAVRRLFEARRRNTTLERRTDYLRDLMVRPELAKDIRSFELAPTFRRVHEGLGLRILGNLLRVQRQNVVRETLAGVVFAGCLVWAYLLVGQSGTRGEISAAELFLGLTAFTQLAASIVDLIGVGIELEEHATYMADYRELTERPPPRDGLGAAANAAPARLPQHTSTLELRDVHYAYPHGPAVLRGVSLRLEPGELVALMGRNGAGKSTIVKLLLGLLQPDRGAVLLDGQDVTGLPMETLRRAIGALFQDYGHYELSLAESIRLGWVHGDLDSDRLRTAIDAAGLERLVASLPHREATPLGRLFPGGRELSGGQWQRVALARVLYRQAGIWILDEPTAALDVTGEAAFLEGLRAERGGRTTLIVTHRLETARVADRIVLLDDGVVAEQGSHHELLRRDGHYAALQRRAAAASAP
jgi:ATP-binding cassette subfamily B protein